MSLGKKLYDLRTSKDLKQEQVAYDLEIVQSTYSDWENNVSTPKRENLIKLAEYFGVEVNDFDDEIYSVNIKNKKNGIALVNCPNTKINSTEAILKIAESLEKLTLLVEKLITK
ncbi:helix-turn-helix domain-containing protein [Flavobacterium sp.]|uniref:helix-turn-helix domain-containing protein n=1 Tax=Flavobacterium sp. TaxID=239 RepID=UPI0037525CFD